MLTYTFENLHGQSMYAHLYQCIKEDILNGKLEAEDKLPSKRTLAKNLGISLITVENAYAQLMIEGYIYSRPKRGYYVAKIMKQPPLHQEVKQNSKLQLPQKQAFSFASGNVPAETFPYNIWSRLLRQVLTAANENTLLCDTSCGGIVQLRQAIAQHLYQFRGMQAEPEQIIIGAGTQVLYNLIVQLLGRNHIYALEDPGYPQLAAIYKANNVFCRYLPMDKNGVSREMLENSGADILHITPSHQFPTGIIMPASRRYELLHWAGQSSSRYIIEDDYDCEFRLYGRPIPTLPAIQQKRLSISIPFLKPWHLLSVSAIWFCHHI